MKDNWDTRTAKDCKIKDVLPESCRKCRDFDFCQKNRQISIDEYLEKLSGEWKRIPPEATVIFPKETKVPKTEPVIRRSELMAEPDLVLKGTVNRVPSFVGFKEWVSGPNDCYHEFELLQYKEIQK